MSETTKAVYRLNCPNSVYEDAYVSPGEVLYLLKGLDIRKASGPDGVSTYMLKATAESIAPSLAKVFSLSLYLVSFPVCGSQLVLFTSTSLEANLMHQITDRSLYFRC